MTGRSCRPRRIPRQARANFPALFGLLHQLYGSHYDFFYHLEAILATAASSYSKRAGDLKALDMVREADSGWFRSQRMVGGVCYIALYNRNNDDVSVALRIVWVNIAAINNAACYDEL